MSKRITILSWATGLVLLTACNHKTVEQRYVDFINDPDNKIVQKIKVGNVEAVMKWVSPQYQKLISKNKMETQDDGFFYFNAKFNKKSSDKPSKEKITYLDFDMQNDFVLSSGINSIAPAICQKIENGITGSYEYILAFEKPAGNNEKDFTVVYNDKIFGMGTIAFAYNYADIKKIPELKLNKPE
jgi:hypothetical protein